MAWATEYIENNEQNTTGVSDVMEGFAKFVGFLIAAAVVCAALAGVAFLVTVVIAFWPIIVGFGVLLFLGYALFVGLVHIGSGKVK